MRAGQGGQGRRITCRLALATSRHIEKGQSRDKHFLWAWSPYLSEEPMQIRHFDSYLSATVSLQPKHFSCITFRERQFVRGGGKACKAEWLLCGRDDASGF